ncbi:transposase [Chryseobacterium rhizosphaerae]|jgi:hypothetical protein|uniref:Transposase n=1 Tax=Chryseobacterium rhizosphaerae TaxID=395937 RepID=A0ABX9IFK8_9FLAO|nr:transposase [Chryseobacterium rhizosphaerae]MDC8101797.1 transposase [Chryseobacterium rhizosphaerae]MDR6547696.1 hypothetical protein [Chryseobacterium rhizosphaerae]REC71813.1 transposase [Chryseobacterium rhizosphaerae]GEN69170.1 hypothetical protein CRH01_37380 [Chryseobacterium rhizosphaerae]
MESFKIIHIGSLIKQCVEEKKIGISRISNFFKCSIKEIDQMYLSESLDSNILLQWCKLTDYDFFRIYSQHLILFSPPASLGKNKISNIKISNLPEFKKSLYTQGIINFILELIESGTKTRKQIIEDYRIPKTTLYTWMKKYKK